MKPRARETRFAPPARDKREELKTYRELELRRDLKSVRARKRIEANGQRRVLGDGSSTQPYLIVEAKRHRQVRLQTQKRLLLEARSAGLELPVDLLLDRIAPRIDELTYAQLAREAEHESMRHVPLAALGRALTKEERAHFAAAANAPRPRAANTALNHVLGRIEERQGHNPARYQTIWAQVVGADAAQQTYLDRIDPATQTAWFR